MNSAPWIVSAACCVPPGPTIALADAAVRAGLALRRRHASYVDAEGDGVRVSRFQLADEAAVPDDDAARWAWLARWALAQLTLALPDDAPATRAARLRLYLVLPDAQRQGLPTDLEAQVQAALLHPWWPWQSVHVVRGGHAAGLLALQQAAEHLARQPQDLAVLLAAESGLGHRALLHLDLQGLLHGTLHHGPGGSLGSRPHGRTPGEGAAAVALTADPRWAARSSARVLGCATADEPHTRTRGTPCTGAALGAAARQAHQQAQRWQPGPIGRLLVDLNGETYRADEFGFTALRLGKTLQDGWQHDLPALATGDLNTASAVAHVALAAYAAQQRPTAAHRLVLASSDDALRGAAVIGATRAPSPLYEVPEVRPWRSASTSTA